MTTNKPSTTPAQIRHRERIARTKADLQAAIVAEQHARRRRDISTSHMWLEAISGLRRKLDDLTTARIAA